MPPGASLPEVRAAQLRASGALRARLAYYRPGTCQSAHSHCAPHVSVVVAGSFRETTPAGERTVRQGSVGFRADGARHSVSFGPAGALILALETDSWTGGGLPRSGVCWVTAPAPLARSLLDLARGGAGAAGEAALLLGHVWSGGEGACPPPVGEGAPDWVDYAAEHLLAAPAISIAELARRSGVHRVHFSRAFARRHGMAPSLFRRRAMAAQALSEALGEEPNLAAAAARAGFADQSHMARAIRESCGLAAGALRRLLCGKATSVQSGPLRGP